MPSNQSSLSYSTVPAWTALGLLPPNNQRDPTDHLRSPYRVSLLEFVQRFHLSAQRRSLLQGLLAYRCALHSIGMKSGWQWLNGSFVEDIERRDRRPPNDIDVVTFLDQDKDSGSGFDTQAFDRIEASGDYQVDAYIVELGTMPLRKVVQASTYWYGMWSHRRDEVWKGFMEVDLAPHEDLSAQAWLEHEAHAGAKT